jgi:hypothetical protein
MGGEIGCAEVSIALTVVSGQFVRAELAFVGKQGF